MVFILLSVVLILNYTRPSAFSLYANRRAKQLSVTSHTKRLFVDERHTVPLGTVESSDQSGEDEDDIDTPSCSSS